MAETKTNQPQAVPAPAPAPVSTLTTLQGYFNNEACIKNLQAMLGQKAQGFATSVLSVVNNNKLLRNADAGSIYSSAMVAASLDLPINPSLGFAALVPYKGRAQFQIMVRGLTQLAIRSGQYAKITNCDVHEGELVKYDPFTDDYEFDASKRKSDKIVGYMAYFRTVGGFEKYYYMTKEEAMAHGKRYSKSYTSADGLWRTNPDAMGRKTCLKMLLSKFGILSIELQRALRFDQGVAQGDFASIQQVEDIDAMEVDYVDNPQGEADEKKAKQLAEKFKDFETPQTEKNDEVAKQDTLPL